jgi:hypothetical protein
MSFMPVTTDRQLALRLKKLRSEAAQQQSTEMMQSSLDLAGSESKETYESFAQQSLDLFVRNNEEASLLPLIAYLLESTNATLDSASRYISYQSASIPLFALMSNHGWDINQPDKSDHGRRVLDLMITNEEYVHWLLDHGAQVNHIEPEPVLDLCARVGSLATFKLLQENGAEISRRTLHCAAQAAAACGVEPAEMQPEGLRPEMRDRVDLLRYLIEGLKMDVNMLDDDSDNPIDTSGHWGTPLGYAASQPQGAGVVRWLLAQGFNPRLGKRGGACNAWWVARVQGNAKVLAALDEWAGSQGNYIDP